MFHQQSHAIIAFGILRAPLAVCVIERSVLSARWCCEQSRAETVYASSVGNESPPAHPHRFDIHADLAGLFGAVRFGRSRRLPR